MSGNYSTETLCATLGVSRSGYYAWKDRPPSPRAIEGQGLRVRIQAAFAGSRRTFGSPRIARQLGCPGSRNRIARFMREAGLQGRQKRRYRVRTTDSRHDQPIAPNHLALAPAPIKADQIWVTDITYVETAQGWLYLAGVLDLYSRRLIGWAIGSSLETALPLAALHMALRQRRPAPGLLHHSDRGCQYASALYRKTLADHGCVASMSRKGNCYDNATMESFWSTLKHELVYRCRWDSRDQATTAIFDYIEGFYNRTRLHSALGYQSPLDYESNLN